MTDISQVQPASIGWGSDTTAAPGWAQAREGEAARLVACLIAAALVCLLVVFAVSLFRASGLVAALWGAAGVGVIGWLSGPRTRAFDLSYGLFIATGFLIGNVLVGNSLGQVGVFLLANMVEVCTAVWLIRRFNPVSVDVSTLAGLTKFLLAAPVLAPIPAGLIAAGGLAALGAGDPADVFETFWLGHCLGLAIIAPLGLTLTRARLQALAAPKAMAETVLLLGAVGGAAMFAFFASQEQLAFLVTPLLLLAAVRLRLFGASAGILIVTLIAMTATLQGHGPMVIPGDLEESVRLTQLFIIFGCLPMLPVVAVLDERDRLAAIARAGQAKAELVSEGKSRLLANVSHEIKSPIAGIIGIGELLGSGQLGPTTPTQVEMSGTLVHTARQIESLAYDLLDVANAEAGTVTVNLAAVDLPGMVEDVRRKVEAMSDAQGLAFHVEQVGDGLVAKADSVRTAQIVANLATNAVKYGGAGGVVIFRTSAPKPGWVRVEVIDRGLGLTPEKQAQLFEPFNRLGLERSTIEGHGIGLALAKRLAELQGGAISVTSAPGQGACFALDLPAA